MSVNNAAEVFTGKKFVFLGATLCCLLWGSAYPAIKSGYEIFQIAGDDIPSKIIFAGYRFMMAGLFLLVFAALTGKPLFNFQCRQYGQMALLGLLQTTLQYTFFYIGLAYTTGVKGSIMNATGVFFSVLLAHFVYQNDRTNANKLIGCLIGFIGVMVVNLNEDMMNFTFVWQGDGFVILAAFVLSATTLYGKHLSQSIDPGVMTGYQLFFGGVLLTLGGILTGGSLSFHGGASVAILGYLAVLSSVAFALWSLLLKYNRVSMVAPFNFLIPVSGVVLSAVFLNENIFEWKNVVALVLVCIGIGWVNKTRGVRVINPRQA